MAKDIYVGIDLGTLEHRVCVLEDQASRGKELALPQTADDLAAFAARLLEQAQGEPTQVQIAVEAPNGPLVEFLVERGFRVLSINPKQADRFRDRHSLAGAKDDRRDAYVLAASVRTDGHLFRELKPADPDLIELREATRTEEELKGALRQGTNRLRAQLLRSFPAVLALSPAADEGWFWDLLLLAPTADLARRVRKGQLERLLKRHRIRRFTPDEVFAVLRAPQVPVAAGTSAAVARYLTLAIPQLLSTNKQLKACAQWRDELLERLSQPANQDEKEHRDVDIILSVPGFGPVTTATVLAEGWEALSQRDYHALRALSGAAPVTRQSGGRVTVHFRRAVNGRLRNALYQASRCHVQHDASARTAYKELRRRGHNHGRALRSIGDRLLRTLIAMLSAGSLWDPTRRPAHHAA